MLFKSTLSNCIAKLEFELVKKNLLFKMGLSSYEVNCTKYCTKTLLCFMMFQCQCQLRESKHEASYHQDIGKEDEKFRYNLREKLFSTQEDLMVYTLKSFYLIPCILNISFLFKKSALPRINIIFD